MYDSYLPMVRRGGGLARLVRLEPPHWRIDEAKLAAAVTPKTRAIVICTPGNPSSNVLGPDDLALVARYAERANAVVISDEVWEHVLFDGRKHASMLHALRDRTIKIGSAGKMFSMTGWKVGFACAAPPLTDLFAKAHQFLTFTTPPNLQKAVAYGLGKSAEHFAQVRAGFERGRDRLANGLTQAGYRVLPAAGAYFLSVDLAASSIDATDQDFAIRAVKEAGVAVIPYSAFYAEPDAPPLVRLCFAKSDSTLDRGIERLATARKLFA
jgi:N-succinyldiaminopimelate aminotransferase